MYKCMLVLLLLEINRCGGACNGKQYADISVSNNEVPNRLPFYEKEFLCISSHKSFTKKDRTLIKSFVKRFLLSDNRIKSRKDTSRDQVFDVLKEGFAVVFGLVFQASEKSNGPLIFDRNFQVMLGQCIYLFIDSEGSRSRQKIPDSDHYAIRMKSLLATATWNFIQEIIRVSGKTNRNTEKIIKESPEYSYEYQTLEPDYESEEDISYYDTYEDDYISESNYDEDGQSGEDYEENVEVDYDENYYDEYEDDYEDEYEEEDYEKNYVDGEDDEYPYEIEENYDLGSLYDEDNDEGYFDSDINDSDDYYDDELNIEESRDNRALKRTHRKRHKRQNDEGLSTVPETTFQSGAETGHMEPNSSKMGKLLAYVPDTDVSISAEKEEDEIQEQPTANALRNDIDTDASLENRGAGPEIQLTTQLTVTPFEPQSIEPPLDMENKDPDPDIQSTETLQDLKPEDEVPELQSPEPLTDVEFIGTLPELQSPEPDLDRELEDPAPEFQSPEVEVTPTEHESPEHLLDRKLKDFSVEYQSREFQSPESLEPLLHRNLEDVGPELQPKEPPLDMETKAPSLELQPEEPSVDLVTAETKGRASHRRKRLKKKRPAGKSTPNRKHIKGRKKKKSRKFLTETTTKAERIKKRRRRPRKQTSTTATTVRAANTKNGKKKSRTRTTPSAIAESLDDNTEKPIKTKKSRRKKKPKIHSVESCLRENIERNIGSEHLDTLKKQFNVIAALDKFLDSFLKFQGLTTVMPKKKGLSEILSDTKRILAGFKCVLDFRFCY